MKASRLHIATAIAPACGALISIAVSPTAATPPEDPAELKQLQQQFLKYQFGLFLHFNMGTFASREWANGYEDPSHLPARQIRLQPVGRRRPRGWHEVRRTHRQTHWRLVSLGQCPHHP